MSVAFDEVAPLIKGRSVAIELGRQDGDMNLELELARAFEVARCVDDDPRTLAALEKRAARLGIDNARSFGIDGPWDEPSGAADYVYAPVLFREIADWVQAAGYLPRISMALHSGGIAQLRFDTRPNDLAHRLGRRLTGGRWSGGPHENVQTIQRSEAWVRDRIRNADLEVIGERGQGTADHWVVARRR
jgi:hypothetical protein